MHNFWLSHFSVATYPDERDWVIFLNNSQRILDAKITHLDCKDPVRRKVNGKKDTILLAEYILNFDCKADSRYLYGRLKEIDVSFSISLYRNKLATVFPNKFYWYFPFDYWKKEENLQRLVELFELGNHTLSSFYSFGDQITDIAKKKKQSGAVDIQQELLGIFWLTYFNKKYVDFFGRDKFESLEWSNFDDSGNVTIRLSNNVVDCVAEQRIRIENFLGEEHFVNPDSCLEKETGKHALRFSDLILV